MENKEEKKLIEGTIADLKAAIEQCRIQLREKEERLASWERHLERMGGQVKDRASRRPKGQNLGTLLGLFRDTPDQKMTIADMVKKTGLPFSSVQAIIRKADSPFIEANGGLWTLKPFKQHEANGKDASLKN